MKKQTLLTLAAAAVLLATPVLASAHCGKCDHEQSGQKVAANEHGAHNMTGSMAMDGGTDMLPTQTVDGVTAMVHIKDVKAAMAKMGMAQTHHFMVSFSQDKGGKALEPQVVAVKVTDPSGKEGAPQSLMAMQGHAGADLTLAAKGEYRFKVAAKFADGRTLQYQFSYQLK